MRNVLTRLMVPWEFKLERAAAKQYSLLLTGPNDTSYSQQPHVPPSSTFPRTSTSVSMQPQTNMPGELLQAHVVKGGMGFGFTIADSPYGQKVKQILDAPRCTELQEGDILVEINGRPLHRCTHNEAVNILKECPRGQQAVMLIQRGGMCCLKILL